jgi:hypothetical protein
MIIYVLLLFLPILLFIGSSQQAQTVTAVSATKGVFLDASVGASIPLGAYAKSDPTSEQSGFSSTGTVVQLNCDWIGNKDFGLAVQYTFQLNPLKSNSKDVIISGMSVPLGSGDWTNHYLTGGPVFMKYFGKIFFEAKALIGVIISTSPFFKTEDPAFHNVDSNTGTGFAWSIGAGIGYRVSSSVALKVNAEYRMGTPKIDRQYGSQLIGYKDSAYVYSPPITFDTKKVVSAFNLGVSIIFKIPG